MASLVLVYCIRIISLWTILQSILNGKYTVCIGVLHDNPVFGEYGLLSYGWFTMSLSISIVFWWMLVPKPFMLWSLPHVNIYAWNVQHGFLYLIETNYTWANMLFAKDENTLHPAAVRSVIELPVKGKIQILLPNKPVSERTAASQVLLANFQFGIAKWIWDSYATCVVCDQNKGGGGGVYQMQSYFVMIPLTCASYNKYYLVGELENSFRLYSKCRLLKFYDQSVNEANLCNIRLY